MPTTKYPFGVPGVRLGEPRTNIIEPQDIYTLAEPDHNPQVTVNLPDDGGRWGVCTVLDAVYVVRWDREQWVLHDSCSVPKMVARCMGVVAS